MCYNMAKLKQDGDNMYTQAEVLNEIKKFGEKLTSQTLRNYIKDKVCEGAYGADDSNGISRQGVPALYYRRTILEATVAKKLRLFKKKRYYMNEIAFAYNTALEIMNNPDFDMLSDKVFLEKVFAFFGASQVFLPAEENRISYNDVFVKVDEKINRKLYDLKKIVGIWLLILGALAKFDLYGNSHGMEKPDEFLSEVFVEATRPYFVKMRTVDNDVVISFISADDVSDNDVVIIKPQNKEIYYHSTAWLYGL